MVTRRRFINGLSANAAAQASTICIQLATVPLLLTHWGTSVYGEWLLLTSAIAFLNFSSLGLISASSASLAMKVAAGNASGAGGVLAESQRLLQLVGLAVTITVISLSASVDLKSLMGLTEIGAADTSIILASATISVFAVQQCMLIEGAFKAIGRYATGVGLNTAIRVVEFGALVTIVATGGGPARAALGGLAARAAGLQVMRITLPRLAAWTRRSQPNRRIWRFDHLKPLARPSTASAGVMLADLVVHLGPIQLIGATSGSAAVATFSAHRTLANVLTQSIKLVQHALSPELSFSFGRQDRASLRRLFGLTLGSTIVIAAATAIGLLIGGAPLMLLWTNGQIEFSTALFGVLLAWVTIRAVWLAVLTLLSACNLHPRVTRALLATSIPAMALASWWAGTDDGLGVVAPFVVGDLVLTVYGLRQATIILEQSYYQVGCGAAVACGAVAKNMIFSLRSK